MKDTYKYEVAFSFLTRDEPLAQRLNDLLQSRMKTFIYPERQLELAGNDGEIILKRAFGVETRIVVILYRNEWGTNPWTRIEQDAIRERAYHHGYEFCVLIPLETPPAKPEWFPSNRIWIGLERWGIDAAAAVIEARIQDAGGTSTPETLADRKARQEREILAAERRKIFLESEAAVQPAEEHAKEVLTQIQRLASSLSTEAFPLTVEPDNGGIRIVSYRFVLQAYWDIHYSNSLKHSGFFLRLIEMDRKDHLERKFDERMKRRFCFSINEAEQHGWNETSGNDKFLTSSQLAELALQIIVDAVTRFRGGQASDLG